MSIFVPAQPFPPGEYIQDELNAREWTIDDLADVTGITSRQIINLIQGKSGITPDTARALAEAFGQEAQTWMNLQAAYELAMSAQHDRGIARRAQLYAKAPVRELRRRTWIADTDEIETLERDICSLLGIADIKDEPNMAVAARKSTGYSADTAAQLSWYGRCKNLAQNVYAAEYKDENWEPGIAELMKLATSEEDLRRVPKLLAEMGVRLVVVQHLRQTKIDGVALWLDDSSPVIGMSLRFDRIDNFWFTLLHELIHVKYRDQNTPVDVDIDSDDDLPEVEVRANAEASAKLIPTANMESFIKRMRPHYYQERVVQFAAARERHPGIVVGQLQRRKELKYNQLRKLLVKVRERLIGSVITDGWSSALQE